MSKALDIFNCVIAVLSMIGLGYFAIDIANNELVSWYNSFEIILIAALFRTGYVIGHRDGKEGIKNGKQ